LRGVQGFRFPPEIIVLAVRWYMRYALSYRDVEELLTQRDSRWITSACSGGCSASRPCSSTRSCRHPVGTRWCVDETDVKVAGRWRYVYRAADQYGQIIDVCVSPRHDTQAARRFFETALATHGEPIEARRLRAVIEELIRGACHNIEQYANNRIDADHGRLRARLRPMRGFT
jgi:transposase, IS6 family